MSDFNHEKIYEETAVYCYCFGYRNKWIFRNFHMNSNELYDVLEKYGIRNKYNNNHEERNQKIIREYESTEKSMSEVADGFDLTKKRVSQIIKRAKK